MKTHPIVTLWLAFLMITSCGSTTDKETNTNNNVKFEVQGSGPYKLTMRNTLTDSVILEVLNLDCKPLEFYKQERRYLLLCKENDGQNTIWEVEEDLKRIMQLDLNESDLKGLEKFK